MPIKLARTPAEAHLFMGLRLCEGCGESDFSPPSAVIMYEGDLASRYRGECPHCGAEREFLFRVPAEPTLPEVDEPVFGTDQTPSVLLDPGEWLWVADMIAASSPAEPAGLDAGQRHTVLLDLRTAAAAVAEVLKFVPEGADRVPADRFWSAPGRDVYASEPGRFRVGRLEVVRQAYRDLADRFAD